MATRGCMNRGFATEDREENEDVKAPPDCVQHVTDTGNEKEARDFLDSRDVTEAVTEDDKSSVRALLAPSREGLFFAALSAFLYAVKNILLNYLIFTIDPFQSVMMVMQVALICSLATLFLKKIPPPKTLQQYAWLIGGGLPSSLAFSAAAVAVTFIDVADVVTISFSSLIFVGVLGWIILREKPYVFDFVFALVALSGVVCILRPRFAFGQATEDAADDLDDEGSNDLIIGVCMAMLMAFLAAFMFVLMRRQSQLGIHTFTSVACLTFEGVVINSIICTARLQWRVPAWNEWLYALGAGFSFFGALASMVVSLSKEPPTLVNIVLTLEIAFTFLLQFVFLRVTPHWTSYVGAGLVVTACIGIGLKKRREE